MRQYADDPEACIMTSFLNFSIDRFCSFKLRIEKLILAGLSFYGGSIAIE